MPTGDMPVVLMFDGPSLGGFVCPATITSSQIWKMGQVAANDTVHFKRLTLGPPPPPATEMNPSHCPRHFEMVLASATLPLAAFHIDQTP